MGLLKAKTTVRRQRRMKLKNKALFLVLLTLLATALIAGCSNEKTPYEINNSENYTVSIKYDANGGIFTTNTSVIVDTYSLDELGTNSEGKAEIALLSPDNKSRGNDAFTAINNGHFLAGWYSERIETENGYTYSGKWDFENGILEVDASGEYTAEEPVLTLYAAWIPLFEVEFYNADTGELTDTMTFDPTVLESISVPEWDEETGAIEMYDFPERTGYTFKKAYYDAEMTSPVETEKLVHTGVVDEATGTAANTVMKLYVEWTEGEWFRIYNTEQFVENASLNGCYEILADLDFTDEIWPTSFMYGNFAGKIKGNGHTLSNIEFEQTNNSKVNAGLFGYVTENAEITDVNFENVTFTIKAGTRVVGTSYGLFAGTLSKDAVISGVNITGSMLHINTACYFGVDDYSIGLVCGMGDASVIDTAEIGCSVVGDEPEKITVEISGNAVSITAE